ncbi:MAG: bifunctional diaminohydroxyphosphoribosylaminopyrimidine deaminase/5-amino-6-(5-phosphoribosylamino)uracil reductase RibD [Phycisphaeraceae bacterium]|nr:bifunctional diaminohydroxyphosphoribosylaminopyrimidine deaminase/5-amino-6-(5-phosphoribosylamino)uracil reductase RibD [Phycisphaeraceae bacterium]
MAEPQGDDRAEREGWMKLALRLASQSEGDVEPNPMVGAVIVHEGRELGRGRHRRFGGPHAEIEAISDARNRGHDPAGAEMFVTLEPCSHVGKTPPCCDAVIEAGLSRVWVAMRDPFSRVDGRGIERLRQAGIEVHVGLLGEEARKLNRPFIRRVMHGVPWVIAKWAQTLDGFVATRTGDSRWISGPASRAWVHQLRSRVDAVITGIGTVLADDCLLTARLQRGRVRRKALRIVMDGRLQLPVDSALTRSAREQPVWAVTVEGGSGDWPGRRRALEERGVEVVPLPPDQAHPGRPDIASLLKRLASDRQATRVMVEAGPKLLSAMIQGRWVDEAAVFVCPKVLGDPSGRNAVEGWRVERMDDCLRFNLESQRAFEQDILVRGVFPWAIDRLDQGAGPDS